ncbi:MAG: zinc ribbon domain-containing protein [Roseiflexaceae bacterium]
MERRAESKGHHAIARLLNAGIDIGNGSIVPPTPSLLAYRRRPYLEREDPETGDVLQFPRPLPAATWHKKTIEHICRQAVDGVYAGILNWGHRHNRFLEDADGNPKAPVSVDTSQPLVPVDLLEHVQVVERTPTDGPRRMSDFNSFLLSLRCGLCGEAMHGYTSTKINPSGKVYKYRKYRCAGRVNNPGACQMPILSAEALEQVVMQAVFADTAQRDGERLQDEINAAIERHREVLLEALSLLEATLPALARQREEALIAVIDSTLPPTVKKAIIERADPTSVGISGDRGAAADGPRIARFTDC